MGYRHVTVLDFNMGYLSMPLSNAARNILTVVFPFGFYECLVLPQGIAPATDIFQSRMVVLFALMMEEKPTPYLDNIIHMKGENLKEHIRILREIL